MEREGNVLEDRTSFSLFGIYILSFSLLIYISIKNSNILNNFNSTLPSNLQLYMGIFGLLLIISFIKSLINILFAFIFKTTKQSRDYRLNSFLIDITIGLIILPFVFILVFSYTTYLLYFTWAILGLFSLLKIIKGTIIWLPYSNIFKIFLYFCTVEIVPMIVLVKYFIIKLYLFK